MVGLGILLRHTKYSGKTSKNNAIDDFLDSNAAEDISHFAAVT